MKPYAPAMQRFETFQADTYDEAMEAFFDERRPGLMALSKTELAELLGWGAPRKNSKEDMTEQYLIRRWNATELADNFLTLRHYAVNEEMILDEIADSPKEMAELLERIESLAHSKNSYQLSKTMAALEVLRVVGHLWTQVADKIGPDEMEPIDALRTTLRYATEQVLDAVEDRTDDLNPARVTARWIRRNKHLIEERQS